MLSLGEYVTGTNLHHDCTGLLKQATRTISGALHGNTLNYATTTTILDEGMVTSLHGPLSWSQLKTSL